LRLIESISQLPRGGVSPPVFARPFAVAGAFARAGGSAVIVLETPHQTGELPFLAQYVAQEIIGSDEPARRWRDRDNAYRLAGTPVVPARVTVDI
jgi:hypothetical protein